MRTSIFPDVFKAAPLDKMVPVEMLKTIIGRQDLVDFGPKLAWIEAQMEHERGASQSQAAAGGKHWDGDVDMSSLKGKGDGKGKGEWPTAHTARIAPYS